MPTGLEVKLGSIILEAVKTRSYSRVAVMNGPDYLYTRHELHGMGTLNRSVVVTGKPSQPATNAVDVDSQIRSDWVQPRQSLLVTMGTSVLVSVTAAHEDPPPEKPGPGLDAVTDQDVNNGPYGLYISNTLVQGIRTFQSQFGLRWHVVEGTSAKPPPILSNRWVMTHHYDEQYRLSIKVRGIAIFRADALLRYGTDADQYRRYILIPVEPGFERIDLQVTLAQDGLSIEYSFVDRQMSMGAVSPNIVRIDLRLSLHTSRRGLAEVAWEFEKLKKRTSETIAHGVAVGLDFADPTNTSGARASRVAEAASALVERGFEAAELAHSALPKTIVSADIVVLGTPQASMTELVDVALECLKAKINPLKGVGYGSDAMIQGDFTSRTVVGRWTVTTAPLELMWRPGGLSDFPNQLALTAFSDEDIPGFFINGRELIKGPGQQGGVKSITDRGPGILQSLFCQALQPGVYRAGDAKSPPSGAKAMTARMTTPPKDAIPEP